MIEKILMPFPAKFKKPLLLVTRPIESGEGAFYAIDILRGLAAMAILIFHYKNFFVSTNDIPFARIYENPAAQILWAIHKYGANAVMLFWAISGFVFMHVYAGKKSISTKEFWINRVARLYPLHLATLLIIAGLQFVSLETLQTFQIYQVNDAKHFLLQIFFASQWGFEDGPSFNGPIWSVSIEILIYAVFCLYFKSLPINLLSLAATIFIFVFLFFMTDSMIALCGYYFFVGSAVYATWQVTTALPQKLMFYCGLAATLSVIIVMFIISSVSFSVSLALQLSALFAATIFTIAAGESAFGNKTLKKFSVIGDITYSSYLLHSPIQIAFLIVVGNGLINGSIILNPYFYIGYLVFVCFMAWLTFKYFERPAQKLIRRKFNA